MIVPSGVLHLPTEAVDNSVDKRFIKGLNDGFYYSFVTLADFKTVLFMYLKSIAYKKITE